MYLIDQVHYLNVIHNKINKDEITNSMRISAISNIIFSIRTSVYHVLIGINISDNKYICIYLLWFDMWNKEWNKKKTKQTKTWQTRKIRKTKQKEHIQEDN